MLEISCRHDVTAPDSTDQVGMKAWTYLEEPLTAAVKLHAEADAAGLAGAGELAEQSGEDGAGQRLLQQTESHDHTEFSSGTVDVMVIWYVKARCMGVMSPELRAVRSLALVK